MADVPGRHPPPPYRPPQRHGRSGVTRFAAYAPRAIAACGTRAGDVRAAATWLYPRSGFAGNALADAVSAAEAKLWPAIAELAHGRKVVIAGFSQAAVLAFAMAVRHPDAIAYALPIAGRIPDELLPRGNIRTAPVHALHGTDDDVIGIGASREAIAAFHAAGATAELREFPGIGHTIAPAVLDDLVNHVRATSSRRILRHPRSLRESIDARCAPMLGGLQNRSR